MLMARLLYWAVFTSKKREAEWGKYRSLVAYQLLAIPLKRDAGKMMRSGS